MNHALNRGLENGGFYSVTVSYFVLLLFLKWAGIEEAKMKR